MSPEFQIEKQEISKASLMNITNKIMLYFTLLDLLLFALFGNLWFIFKNEQSLAELQRRRYESRQIAEELRRSSDDLTRMARTYAVTGDPRFLEYFKEISAIRDGKSPRPDNYENIYWDFISAKKNYQPNFGEKISIIDRMKVLHFSELELDILREAKELSDELIKMEVKAFNALQGLYQGDGDTYSVNGKPDPDLARKIVFSEAYHQEKSAIMEKINEFFKLLNSRTEEEVQHVAKLQKRYMGIALTLSTIIITMGTIGFWLFKKDIIRPLSNLSEWVKGMQNGEYNFDAKKYRNDEIGILANTFSNMASQVQNNIFNLEHISRTDHLTQINNRTILDEALITEMYKFERYGTPCSIIMIDVDHFKKINDSYGHLIGDKVLIEISRILTKMIRLSDILGRWGGEEFLIICPNTDLIGGRALAELLRKHIANHEFDETLHVTVSLGVSVFEKGTSAEGTVKNADQLLYKAKSEGRNRVA